VVREGYGEALTGARIGQAIEPRKMTSFRMSMLFGRDTACGLGDLAVV
jgi:hypothetical protein